MAGQKLSIEITAKLDEFQKEIEKTPGITKKEVRKLVKEMKTQLVEAEKAAGIAAKAAEKAWGDAFSGMEELSKRAVEKMGGAFSDIGGTAIDATGDIAKILGPLGSVGTTAVAVAGTVLGIGLAFGGAAYAAKGLTDAAVEAEARLVEMGRAAEIPADAREALDAYTAATAELGVQLDILTATLGGEVAPLLTRVASTVTVLTHADELLVDALAASGDEGRRLGDVLSSLYEDYNRAITAVHRFQTILLSGGGILAYEALADKTYDAVDAQTALTVAAAEKAAADKVAFEYNLKQAEAEDERRRKSAEQGDAIIAAAPAKAKAAADKIEADEKRAHDARLARLKSYADAVDQGNEEQAAANAKYRAEELAKTEAAIEQIANNRAFDEFMAKFTGPEWQEAADAANAAAAAVEAGWIASIGAIVDEALTVANAFGPVLAGISELLAQQIDQVAEQGQAQVDRAREAAAEWADAERTRADAARDAAADANDAWRSNEEERIDALLESGAISETEHYARIAEMEREAATRTVIADRQAAEEAERIAADLAAAEEAADALADDERDRAMKAFRRSQALAATQATIAAATAAIAMIPSFGFMGPLAPVGAATAAAAALGMQLAIIANQSPPSFPTGLDPDHFNVGIQRGEGIASRRAMADPELRDELADGNKGVRRSSSRRGEAGDGGRLRLELDPRMQRLRITSDRRIGKRPRKGR